MKAKHIHFVHWTLVLALFIGAFTETFAATVRGKLFAVGPGGPVPVGGIAVTVIRPDKKRSQPSFSGPDGMYYINVPPGSYTLEVWFSKDSHVRPLLFQVQ